MEHKTAIEILIKMLEDKTLSAEQKEAIRTAMGVLSWTSLTTNRLKNIKKNREKRIQS